MYSLSTRRGAHRKRLSALRLSSDSTVTTLPLYTSPPRHRESDLPDIPSEQPPAYPDSAEEADEDTDPSDTDAPAVYIPSPPPSLPVSPSPRRTRRHTGPFRGHKRQQSVVNASDPYLDSLLERSVHALEMSNALLQSSMSTQTSLSAVLADDTSDRHLEERAQKLSSRIRSGRDAQASWMVDLDEISQSVENLVRGDDSEDESRAGPSGLQPHLPISQSLPTSGLAERMQASSSSHLRPQRRGSRDFRQHHPSASTSSLQLAAHDRSHFIAPAPRAITMYIDSSEAADEIGLPSTLGVRPATRVPATPLPNEVIRKEAGTPEPDGPPDAAPASAPVEHPRRVADILASYVMPRASSSIASSSPPSTASLRRRSSSSSAKTVKRPRVSKSPPPPIRIEGPSSRSRSVTPRRESSPAPRMTRPLTPPIEELSTSSTSSESTTLHVDRTVESLRQILEKQKLAAQSSGKAPAPLPAPRPSLLSPPTVAPVSGTSNATASVSRLFTKARHTTSTRAPSPPKQSSFKGSRSRPSTPVTPAMPSPSPSLLNVPDIFGIGFGLNRSANSSGASTPKRISFAEPIEPYSRSKPEGASAQFRAARTRSRSGSSSKGASRGKGKGNGRGRGKGASKGGGESSDEDGDEDGRPGGWWATWLLGAATGSADAPGGLAAGPGRARDEERYSTYASARSGGSWAMRPGFGNSLEEWGA